MSFHHNPRPTSASRAEFSRSFSGPITIDTNTWNEASQGEFERTLHKNDVVPTFEYRSPEAAQEDFLGTRLSASVDVFEREGSRPTVEGSNTSNIFSTWRSSRSRNICSPPNTQRQRQRGGAFTSARVSSGFKHLTHGQSSREWTLFEQMMENGGQLPPSPSSDSRVPYMSMGSSGGHLATRNNSHVQVEMCQSPTQEDHLCDYPSETQGGNFPSTQPSEDFGIHDYDSEYDCDTSDTSQCTIGPSGGAAEGGAAEGGSPPHHKWNPPTFTPLYYNVLKCAIAYFIASLFTFYQPLSDFIGDLSSYGPGARGPSPSAHMVATVAVYFNPAKTVGAMIEADFFCLMGMVYSALVCGVFVSLLWLLEMIPGDKWPGDILAILWIGLSMSLVAWMKGWMANPSFNTACSMTTILIFTV